MISNMTVNVEFLAGTSLQDAIEESIVKARMWNVSYVCFKFNGVNLSIGQNANIAECLDRYDQRDKHIVSN